MIITAHGGALKTGRNTLNFFETIYDYGVDAIEVDIRLRGDELVLAHLPHEACKKDALTLRYALEYAKNNDLFINCDVKAKFMVKKVLALAAEIGVSEQIIFTGSVSRGDLKNLGGGACAYLNKSFFPLAATPKNAPKIKAIIDKYASKYPDCKIVGINFNYKLVSDEFAKACNDCGVRISTFTVDNPAEIERIAKLEAIDNITTNIPDKALTILNREVYINR